MNLEYIFVKDNVKYYPVYKEDRIIKTGEEVYQEYLENNNNISSIKPTDQEVINSQLLKENATQKLINSDLLKQIAEIKGGTTNANV